MSAPFSLRDINSALDDMTKTVPLSVAPLEAAQESARPSMNIINNEGIVLTPENFRKCVFDSLKHVMYGGRSSLSVEQVHHLDKMTDAVVKDSLEEVRIVTASQLKQEIRQLRDASLELQHQRAITDVNTARPSIKVPPRPRPSFGANHSSEPQVAAARARLAASKINSLLSAETSASTPPIMTPPPPIPDLDNPSWYTTPKQAQALKLAREQDDLTQALLASQKAHEDAIEAEVKTLIDTQALSTAPRDWTPWTSRALSYGSKAESNSFGNVSITPAPLLATMPSDIPAATTTDATVNKSAVEDITASLVTEIKALREELGTMRKKVDAVESTTRKIESATERFSTVSAHLEEQLKPITLAQFNAKFARPDTAKKTPNELTNDSKPKFKLWKDIVQPLSWTSEPTEGFPDW